jgi:DNA-binding NarL/FixJ family response regulator/tetratricopeptide (TPR) repeat protein
VSGGSVFLSRLSRRWPLVGRADELALLTRLTLGHHARYDASHEARREVRRGTRRTGTSAPDRPVGVVLSGAAGVGKTRLAGEVLRVAERRGMTTRWVTATASGGQLPLGPFLAVLPTTGGDAADLVPRALRGLTAGVPPQRLMVGVDDVHLLDELSVRLVRQLARRGAATLVLTVRAGGPMPDALCPLCEDGALARLELEPLSRPDVEELLGAVLSGPVDGDTVSRLWSMTRGNALYLRLLVEGEIAAGRFTQVGGIWRWSGPGELAPGLTELVDQHIGELPRPVEDVLDVLALAEPLPSAVLTRLTSQPALDTAAELGLVHTVQHEGRPAVTLAHPLYGEVRRGRCGRLRARRLRGEIATALAELDGDSRTDLLRRAVLALESDLPADPALLAESAALALRLLDFRLARRLARAAVATGGEFEAGLLLSLALSWSGRGTEAEQVLADLAARSDTELDRVRVLLPRLGNRFFTLERPGEAEAMLEEALRSVHGPAALTLHAWRSVFHAQLGRPAEAIEAADVVFAAPDVPSATLVLAAWGAMGGHAVAGRLAGALAVADRIADLPDELVTAQVRVAVDVFWMRALCLVGELDRAEVIVQRYTDLARDGWGMGRLYGDVLVGELLRERGQVRSAAALFQQASIAFGDIDAGGWRYQTALGLATSLGMAGDAAAARGALDELEAVRHPGFGCWDGELLLARAWVAAAEGITSEAVELARRAGQAAAAHGQPAVELVALHTRVRFGDRGCVARLAELAARLDGPRPPAVAAHAAALAAADPVGLLDAADRFEAMGMPLLAADAAAHAASVRIRRAEHGSAHIAAARARRLAARCEGARTPALVALDTPTVLTEREREIVLLAASGSTNKEIADRLGVSTRTVEGHLYRASTKLGVTNRAQLAESLGTD